MYLEVNVFYFPGKIDVGFSEPIGNRNWLYDSVFSIIFCLLFNFAMKSHPVELSAELSQSSFSDFFFGFGYCMAGGSRPAFLSSGWCSAFDAFERDNDA